MQVETLQLTLCHCGSKLIKFNLPKINTVKYCMGMHVIWLPMIELYEIYYHFFSMCTKVCTFLRATCTLRLLSLVGTNLANLRDQNNFAKLIYIKIRLFRQPSLITGLNCWNGLLECKTCFSLIGPFQIGFQRVDHAHSYMCIQLMLG